MEKNLIEPKYEKILTKTYTFDVTKCDDNFNLLVSDGQIVIPMGLKTPPLEQKNNKGFFVNFIIVLDIKTHNVYFSGILFKTH